MTQRRSPLVVLADATLLVGCGLALLALSSVLYHYAWTRSRVFTGVLAPYVYYGIPTAVSVLLLASLRLPPSARVRIGAVLVTTLIAVYGVAIPATFWDQLPSVRERRDLRRRRQIAAAHGIAFDDRTKAQVVDDLRAGGADAVPALAVAHLLRPQHDGMLRSSITIDGAEVMPLSGISGKRTVLCNESATYINYLSDAHGFNNPPHAWDAPVEILALGDSFTQGHCVDPAENFVARIRQRHPSTVNVGIAGNGPLMMLGTLKEYGRVISPRVVLWFYFEGNDLEEVIQENRSPLLRQYLTRTFLQNLFHRQAALDRALIGELKRRRRWGSIPAVIDDVSEAAAMVLDRPSAIQQLVKLSDLRDKFRMVGGTTYETPNDTLAGGDARRSDERIDLLRLALAEAKTTVSEWGGHLYFVHLPEWSRFDSPVRPVDRDRRAVLHMVRDSGVPVVDVTESFTAQPDAMSLFSLRIGYHYNEGGSRIVANAVLQAIDGVH
jgi:hypothetical protein